MTAYQRIRESQRANERYILQAVRKARGRNERWYPFLMGTPLWNALDRLQAKKRVRYDRRAMSYVIV